MKNRSNYFYIMFWILLILVFIGFAPSFYLKPLISEHPFYPDGLPGSHIVHGVILTLWYIFLVVQSGWVNYNKVHIHRKLGWIGVTWAVLVVSSTVYTVSLFPERMVALAQQLNSTVEEIEPGLVSILWLDVFMCLLFVVFFTLAVLQRNKPDIHKRLMLYTGLVFIFAATNRVAGILGYLTGSDISFILGFLLLLALTVSVLFHDYKTKKRILPISWWCFGLYWLAIVLSIIITETAFGSIILSI